MKRLVTAETVMAARLSDTGDEVQVALRDDKGGDLNLTLPTDQLAVLRAWIDQVTPDGQPARRKPSAFPVENWSVRPAEDEETLVVTFRLARGVELGFKLPRAAAHRFAHALGVLLGTLPPAAPSKSRH